MQTNPTSPGIIGTIRNALKRITSLTGANFAAQTAKTVLAGPSSGSATPTFRSLAVGDLPTPLNGFPSNATGYLANNGGGGLSWNILPYVQRFAFTYTTSQAGNQDLFGSVVGDSCHISSQSATDNLRVTFAANGITAAAQTVCTVTVTVGSTTLTGYIYVPDGVSSISATLIWELVAGTTSQQACSVNVSAGQTMTFNTGGEGWLFTVEEMTTFGFESS